MTTCPNCHNEVPDAPYCVRCGEPLENRASPYPHEGRGYAASPSERWYSPLVVSSIFPHLPRADMHAFRAALAFGGLVIVGLSAFDLFPVALVVAAVLVPLLSLLYLWSVDIYEDEPLPVLAATVAWGVVAGVALGFASRELTSRISQLTGDTTTHDVFWLGVALPVVSVILMLAGPLVLLPYRRFNDVLDGVTFGVGCAVTTLAAEVVTNSSDLLRVGLTAPGDRGLWIARLLALGIALPVLAAGVVGAACGILWLRYRSPAEDRPRLGPLGNPPVALLLAAGALVAAHLFVIYLEQWQALAATTLLAAAAMVALRRVIDLGLREESREIAIGPPIECPNCGRETPRHTFCAECGVALRALPKGGAAGASAQPARARLSRIALPGAFVLLIAATAGIAIAVIEIVKPAPAQPPCGIRVFCSQRLAASASISPPTTVGKLWVSAVGTRLRYDEAQWNLVKKADDRLILVEKHERAVAYIFAVPSTTTPLELLETVRAFKPEHTNGLERDTKDAHAILAAEIGFVAAISEMDSATLNNVTSPGNVQEYAFEAASFGDATVLVMAVTSAIEATSEEGFRSPFPVLNYVDDVMDTFEWNAPSV